MNESTEVTLAQVEACLKLFKAAKLVVARNEVYLYQTEKLLAALCVAINDVVEQWYW